MISVLEMEQNYQYASLNELRASYLNVFSHIFDKSINISCICKATKNPNSSNSFNKNVFEKNHNFMDTDEESDIESKIATSSSYNSDISVNKNFDKICDLSCFENLKFITFCLKNCIGNINLNEDLTQEQIEKFENTWSNFHLLTDNPVSCDYNGTTIFHHTASDNNVHLLKLLIKKYPNGVFSIDSKGMTPLMRAVQRNNSECIELLLNESDTDVNGSSLTFYTPLWFAVSNGYTDVVKILLEYGANPSNKSDSNHSHLSTQSISIDDGLRVPGQRYLFSPLRASIVHSQYEIMIQLLENGANVQELIDINNHDYENSKTRDLLKPIEKYVDFLKFLFRNFGNFSTLKSENIQNIQKYLNILNDYIENPNIYRRMLIEFVKDVCFKIKNNIKLLQSFTKYLIEFEKFSFELLTEFLREIQTNKKENVNWDNFLALASDFMISFDAFLLHQFQGNDEERLSLDDLKIFEYKKANYYKEMFEFSKILFFEYFAPKTLKDLCRYKIRVELFKNLISSNMKYKKNFTKKNHRNLILNEFGVPNYLINYILKSNI